MKKLVFFYILFAFLTISCDQSESKKSLLDFGITEPLTGNHSENDPIPNEALTFDANINLINFSVDQTEKMNQAIDIIKMVVGTEEFRKRVLNHTFNGAKSFADNGGYSNAQIYQIILDGAEGLYPSRNNLMEAEVELYYADTNIVGYTYPSTSRIWVNTKFFDSYTAAGVAHNLFHEWLHKLGFEHEVAWSVNREYSVPYALGYLMGEIGKNFL